MSSSYSDAGSWSHTEIFSFPKYGSPLRSNPRFTLILTFIHELRLLSRSSDGSLTTEDQLDRFEGVNVTSSTLHEFLNPDRSKADVHWLLSTMPMPEDYDHAALEKSIASRSRRKAKRADPVGLEGLTVVAHVKIVTGVVHEEGQDWRCPVVSVEVAEAALKEEAGEEREECTVCLEELGAKEMRARMPCSHPFHKECIVKWLTESSNSCPTCRYMI